MINRDDNFFKLFKINESVDMSIDELDKSYCELQGKHHPDVGGNVRDVEWLNLAYSTLKDDLLRSEYFLKIKGYKFSNDFMNHNLDTDFMMEIIEISDNTKDNHMLLSQKKDHHWKMFKSATEAKDYELALKELANLKFLNSKTRGIFAKVG